MSPSGRTYCASTLGFVNLWLWITLSLYVRAANANDKPQIVFKPAFGIVQFITGKFRKVAAFTRVRRHAPQRKAICHQNLDGRSFQSAYPSRELSYYQQTLLVNGLEGATVCRECTGIGTLESCHRMDH